MEIFNLSKSNKPNKKKYMVSFVNPETKRNNIIHFGAKNMDDFTLTNDINQKNRYIRRHEAREDWTYTGRFKPGFWSRWLLWNKPTILSSIKDIEKQFKIKINNKIDDKREMREKPSVSRNKTIDKVIQQKPSAYRSMQLAKLGLSKKNNKNDSDLLRWQREMWLNLNALIDTGKKLPCGQKYKGQTTPTVCRPSVRVNEKTPTLASEYTNNQIRKAIEMKKLKNRIKWNEL